MYAFGHIFSAKSGQILKTQFCHLVTLTAIRNITYVLVQEGRIPT